MAPSHQPDGSSRETKENQLRQYADALCELLRRLLRYLTDKGESNQGYLSLITIQAAEDHDCAADQLFGKDMLSLKPVIEKNLVKMTSGDQDAWYGVLMNLLTTIVSISNVVQDCEEASKLFAAIADQNQDGPDVMSINYPTGTGLRCLFMTSEDYGRLNSFVTGETDEDGEQTEEEDHREEGDGGTEDGYDFIWDDLRFE